MGYYAWETRYFEEMDSRKVARLEYSTSAAEMMKIVREELEEEMKEIIGEIGTPGWVEAPEGVSDSLEGLIKESQEDEQYQQGFIDWGEEQETPEAEYERV